MKIQILHPFAIQSQPRLNVCVFGVTGGGIRISLLDFASAFLIDLRQHRPERDAKNGALRPAPTAPVRQRLGKLYDLSGYFHSKIDKLYGNSSGCQPWQAMRLPYKLSMISRRRPGPR